MFKVVIEPKLGVSEGHIRETENPRRVPAEGESFEMLRADNRVEYLKAKRVSDPVRWHGSPSVDVVVVTPMKGRGPIERSWRWLVGGLLVLLVPIVLMTMSITPIGGEPSMADLDALRPAIMPIVFAMLAWTSACIIVGASLENLNSRALRREQFQQG